jgi:hypothetical protein
MEDEKKEGLILSEKADKLIGSFNVEMLRGIEGQFEHLMLRHSEFQIENFIIGQFITPDRKHRQCLQELWTRYQALLSEWYDIEKLKIELRRLALKEKSFAGNEINEEQQIDLDEIKLMTTHTGVRLEMSKSKMTETLREMKKFWEMYNQLEGQRKFKTYEEAEPEYWQNKLPKKNG